MKKLILMALCLLAASTGAAQMVDKKLMKQAERGDTAAQYRLAEAYLSGEGVKQRDDVQAALWFMRAAEAGHPTAAWRATLLFRDAPDLAHHTGTNPADWAERAARSGNVEALMLLGGWYERGSQFTPRSTALARRYYQQAAERGEAEGWYRIGTMLGSLEAPGSLLPERYEPMLRAADMGHVKACADVGKMLFNQPHAALHARAAHYLRLAAEADDAEAANYLGRCYSTGKGGVAQDATEKVKWFRLAAQAGNLSACYNLAYCYEHGEGVAQDLTEAARWYESVIQQDADDRLALAALGLIYYRTDSPLHDYARAFPLLKRAHELRAASASGPLGLCYFNGWGTEANIPASLKPLIGGFANHDREATLALIRIYREGLGGERPNEKLVKYYTDEMATWTDGE